MGVHSSGLGSSAWKVFCLITTVASLFSIFGFVVARKYFAPGATAESAHLAFDVSIWRIRATPRGNTATRWRSLKTMLVLKTTRGEATEAVPMLSMNDFDTNGSASSHSPPQHLTRIDGRVHYTTSGTHPTSIRMSNQSPRVWRRGASTPLETQNSIWAEERRPRLWEWRRRHGTRTNYYTHYGLENKVQVQWKNIYV